MSGTRSVISKVKRKIKKQKWCRAVLEAGGSRIRLEWVPLSYDAINLDTNNTCNLRCRFCFNDFSQKPCYMTPETFDKVLAILPMLKDAGDGGTGFYYSCLYEPTVSVRFMEFLKKFPPEGRRKVFFTTNLCRPLSEEMLRDILTANLHHINISIETLQKDRYLELCGSKNFDSFRSNLDRLAAVYQTLPPGKRPKLYYISMILKANCEELPEIVRLTQEKLCAYRNELRTPFIDSYENMGWNYDQFMEPQQCGELEAYLRAENRRLLARQLLKAPWKEKKDALHSPVVYSIHSALELPPREAVVRESEPEPAAAVSAEPAPAPDSRFAVRHRLEQVTIPEYLFVRCSAQGDLHFLGLDERVNIHQFTDVEKEFKTRLELLEQQRNDAFCCRLPLRERADVRKTAMTVNIDAAWENEQTVSLQGWIRTEQELLSGAWDILLQTKGSKGKACFYVKTDRNPALNALCEEGEAAVSFVCHMAKSVIGSGSCGAMFAFADPDSGEIGVRSSAVWHLQGRKG